MRPRTVAGTPRTSPFGKPAGSIGSIRRYLLPWDADPSALGATALQLDDVLRALGQTKAKDVLAFTDSCFSGAGGRSVLPPGARPLVHVKATAATANVALFSAATGAEIAGPAADGAGGLFSSFVAQALGQGEADLDGDGMITVQEMAQWVTGRVARRAKQDSREQTPSLLFGNKLGATSNFNVGWGLPVK